MWAQPLSAFIVPPPTKSQRPATTTHTFSYSSLPLITQLCLCHSLALFCILESAPPDGLVPVWPADSRFSWRPRVQGDADEQFFWFCPLFKTPFFIFCQHWSSRGGQRASGEAEQNVKVAGLTFVTDWVKLYIQAEKLRVMVCYNGCRCIC